MRVVLVTLSMAAALIWQLLCWPPAASLANEPDPPIKSDWSEFRGPNGAGVAVGCQPPIVLDEGNLAWQSEVPPGHSSPVLSPTRLFLTAVDGKQLVTIAIDKQDGRIAWRREAPRSPIECPPGQ